MHSHYRLWSTRRRRNVIYALVRGIAGENSAGFGDAIQALEHLLLNRQIFEHGFDDQVLRREC